MLFNSYEFIFVMLPLSVIGYYMINKKSYKAGSVYLLLCSFVFIGYMNIMYLLLMLPCALLTYLIARFINSGIKKRKALLSVGIIINVAVLLVFKYTNFFIDTLNDLLSKDYAAVNIILPLGISFYTFQQITFLVDYYRDESLKCDILEYLTYICFYPQFIQGPIVLQSEFIPQLRDESRKSVDYEYVATGLYRFILGLSKKVLIADSIAKAVNGGYDAISDMGKISAIATIIGYSLQIYFDFSGYSDMAIGLGRMFHIDLPENFDSPYKAVTIEDFWDRWHITLTRFFTRYIYIPLGGSRKGKLRTYLNILFIFFISGLWHGADRTFIVWGLMHGAAMLVCRLIRDLSGKKSKDIKSASRPVSIIMTAITFIYVSVAWVYFRAESMRRAVRILTRIFAAGWNTITDSVYESFNHIVEVTWLIRLDVLDINEKIPGFIFFIAVVVFTSICMLCPNTKEMTDRWCRRIKDGALTVSLRACIVPALLLTWCILGMSGVTDFIYWSF